MNLSIIERLISEGDMSTNALKYLLSCRSECEWLDYKEQLNLDENKELCNFAKDVLGIKNVGGGYIIVGVKDKTWDANGINSALPYDTKQLRDKIRRSTNIDLDIDIVHQDLQITANNRKFAIIFIRSSHKRSKRRTPTVAGKDFCAHERYGLHRGDIYVRRGDSTVKIQTREELEELLENLELQADQDAFQSSDRPSPFAIEDGLYWLLEKGYDRFIGRQDFRDRIMEAVTHDPRIWIINVHGPGGVGKSALVNWAVYEFYRLRKFESIIHLTAKETVLTESGINRYPGRTLHSLDNLLDQILKIFDEPIPTDIESKKKNVIEIFSAWSTLLVLDNMETVDDYRILNFIQDLPQTSRAKILLTSRLRTGRWELPIPVTELKEEEVEEFLRIKSEDMKIAFPIDQKVCRRVTQLTGGLPLAIQWLMGQYKIAGNIDKVVSALGQKDSPILEFSFRNIWLALSGDAKSILAILTIFTSPPTVQQVAIATEWINERIEKALFELQEATLVTRNIQQSDGRVTYAALPITLSFASHQLDAMGDFERQARQRFQQFNEQMELQKTELRHFVAIFERYGMSTDNEKRAAILCRRGESDMFAGNIDNAELLFKQARELAPQSAYVYAMTASYELGRNRVGLALNYAKEACNRANKKIGALCYTILARVLGAQSDRQGQVDALQKALQFEQDNVVIRHQFGVALSKAGRTEAAIEEFSIIIEKEKNKIPKTDTLLMALKTRVINLKRLGKLNEAKNDVQFANKIIAENPHLQHHAYHLNDLEQGL